MSKERRKRRGLIGLAILALALVLFFAVLSSETDPDPGSAQPDRERAEVADPGVVPADEPEGGKEAVDLLEGPNPFAEVEWKDPEKTGELLVEVRREDGTRVLGAVVFAAATKVKTDEDGYALFPGIEPAAKYGIEVRGPDFYDVPATGWIGVSGGCRSEVRIVVKRGGAVRGRLVTPDGRPVGAETVVGVYRSSNYIQGLPQKTGSTAWARFGAGGRFELAGVPPGTAYVRAMAQWHVGVTSPPLEVLPGKTTEDIVLVLRPAGRISGRVVRRGTTKPIAGAHLSTFSTTGGSGFATSGKDGGFRFGGLPPGTYQLSGSSRGHGFQETFANVTLVGIRVEAGKETSELLVEIGPGGSLVGTLHGVTGEAAQDVRLSLIRELPGVALEDSPDMYLTRVPSGDFEMSDLEPGVYVIRAIDMSAGILAEARVRVDEGKVTRVDLRPGAPVKGAGGTVSGLVTGGDGRPVPNARVWLIAQPGTKGYGNCLAGADGRFTISGVKPGRYAVAAAVSDGLGRSAVLEVEAGGKAPEVTIRLSPTCEVVIHAKHRSGNVAKRVYLTFLREPDHRLILYSGTWGRMATRLLPGRWNVYAGRFGQTTAEPVDTIEVKATGETQSFDVTID